MRMRGHTVLLLLLAALLSSCAGGQQKGIEQIETIGLSAQGNRPGTVGRRKREVAGQLLLQQPLDHGNRAFGFHPKHRVAKAGGALKTPEVEVRERQQTALAETQRIGREQRMDLGRS